MMQQQVIVKILNDEEEARWEAEAREKAWKDEQGRHDFAYNEGKQEGKLEIAQKMRDAGMSDDQIVRILGIAPEQL
jgi:predicted transposase YdaD